MLSANWIHLQRTQHADLFNIYHPPLHYPTHPSGICLFPSFRSSTPTRTSTCSLQTNFIYNGPNMQTFSIYTTLPYTIPLTPSVSVYFHLLGLLRLLVRVHALCKLLRLQRAKHADLPGGAAIRTADVEHGVYLCHPRRGAPATLTWQDDDTCTLRIGLYKIFVSFEDFVQESIPLFANTPLVWAPHPPLHRPHDCAIQCFPPTILYCNTCHTILVMAKSCKCQPTKQLTPPPPPQQSARIGSHRHGDATAIKKVRARRTDRPNVSGPHLGHSSSPPKEGNTQHNTTTIHLLLSTRSKLGTWCRSLPSAMRYEIVQICVFA